MPRSPDGTKISRPERRSATKANVTPRPGAAEKPIGSPCRL